MRARIAAACAALLVGLAPVGVLACTSLGASCVVSVEVGATAYRLVREGSAARRPVVQAVSFAKPRHEAPRALKACDAPARAIWRSPGGPAPSQAPPAA